MRVEIALIALASLTAGGAIAPAARSHPVVRSGRHTPSCDASDLCDLVGYTVVACSNVVGEFNGAEIDSTVALDNGMRFRFTEYNYSYSYRPDAAVLAKSVTYSGTVMTLYKLQVEDETYDVIRVR